MVSSSSNGNRNKIVLVIGAGDATGGSIAKLFARKGYKICVTRRNVEKLAPLLEELRDIGAQAHGFGSDARKEADVTALDLRPWTERW